MGQPNSTKATSLPVISFEDEALPTKKVENEFSAVVAYLAENRTAVKSYVISGEATEAKAYERLASDKRKMAAVGDQQEPAVTIRTKEETLDDGKTVKVWIWATNKIKRETKAEKAARLAEEAKAAPVTKATTPAKATAAKK